VTGEESAGGVRPSRVVRVLLAAYPRAWRERYGRELSDLLTQQRVTPTLVIDLAAGAIDARLHPELAPHPAANASTEGDRHMVGKLAKLRCVGYPPNVTPRDQWTSIAVMLGGTFVLSLLWLRLHVTFGDNAYVDSFSAMPFLAAYMLGMPFTSLKGRSRAAQALFIGGTLAAVSTILLATAFVTSRL
jgi:hypothetical protein